MTHLGTRCQHFVQAHDVVVLDHLHDGDLRPRVAGSVVARLCERGCRWRPRLPQASTHLLLDLGAHVLALDLLLVQDLDGHLQGGVGTVHARRARAATLRCRARTRSPVSVFTAYLTCSIKGARRWEKCTMWAPSAAEPAVLLRTGDSECRQRNAADTRSFEGRSAAAGERLSPCQRCPHPGCARFHTCQHASPWWQSLRLCRQRLESR